MHSAPPTSATCCDAAGPLGSLGGARSAITPSSAARAAGASSAQRQRSAQPIAFSDFCQIVDMQFLTHIRRGTSISVMDFQPSSVPQDLSQALNLLAVTSELFGRWFYRVLQAAWPCAQLYLKLQPCQCTANYDACSRWATAVLLEVCAGDIRLLCLTMLCYAALMLAQAVRLPFWRAQCTSCSQTCRQSDARHMSWKARWALRIHQSLQQCRWDLVNSSVQVCRSVQQQQQPAWFGLRAHVLSYLRICLRVLTGMCLVTRYAPASCTAALAVACSITSTRPIHQRLQRCCLKPFCTVCQ
jgi:hypothetical protein